MIRSIPSFTSTQNHAYPALTRFNHSSLPLLTVQNRLTAIVAPLHSTPDLWLWCLSASIRPDSMADKYRRVDRPQPQLPMLPNEIRITSQGIRKNYISYAIDKLTNVTPLLHTHVPTTSAPSRPATDIFSRHCVLPSLCIGRSQQCAAACDGRRDDECTDHLRDHQAPHPRPPPAHRHRLPHHH